MYQSAHATQCRTSDRAIRPGPRARSARTILRRGEVQPCAGALSCWSSRFVVGARFSGRRRSRRRTAARRSLRAGDLNGYQENPGHLDRRDRLVRGRRSTTARRRVAYELSYSGLEGTVTPGAHPLRQAGGQRRRIRVPVREPQSSPGPPGRRPARSRGRSAGPSPAADIIGPTRRRASRRGASRSSQPRCAPGARTRTSTRRSGRAARSAPRSTTADQPPLKAQLRPSGGLAAVEGSAPAGPSSSCGPLRRALEPRDHREPELGRPRAVDDAVVERDGDRAGPPDDDLAVPDDRPRRDPADARIATSGWLTIGVWNRPPSLPALVTVKVEPRTSSGRASRARAARRAARSRRRSRRRTARRSRARPGRRAPARSAPRRRCRSGRGRRSRRPRAARSAPGTRRATSAHAFTTVGEQLVESAPPRSRTPRPRSRAAPRGARGPCARRSAPHAAERLAAALGRPRWAPRRPRRANVLLGDPPRRARSRDVAEVDAELLRDLADDRRRLDAPPAARHVAGRRSGARAGDRRGRRRDRLARLADDDEHGPDRSDLALGDEDLQHRPRVRRGDLDRRLVRLDLDERVVLGDLLALGDEPAARPRPR